MPLTRSDKRARVFVSFDYDHDRGLKEMLVGQSRLPASPFEIADWSLKQESRAWRVEARRRIERSDLVIVICGHHTHEASGVAEEIAIAKTAGVRYELLRGRKDGFVRRPRGTSWFFDEIQPWTWKSLRTMTKTGRHG